MGFITINNYKFDYKRVSDLVLIQACQKLSIDVPRFCFHDNLSVAGNCRICLVEDIKQTKPVASCSVTVSANSLIYTNSLKVKKAREAVLEFLLINHPLDCPICDQGGECDLQDQAVVFGSDRGRFYENKRAVEDFYCGSFIKTIMNRCIHCTRRIRFSKEVAGVSLGATGRGAGMEIGFYIEKLFDSELSGNVIDLCPVGASTSKPFAFTARPWELKSFNSVNLLDPLQTPVRIDVRGTRIMRILPRLVEGYQLNWIDDRTRFSYDIFRRQRLYYPMIRAGKDLFKVSWAVCLYFIKSRFIIGFKTNPFLPISNYFGNIYDVNALVSLKFLASSLSSPFVNIRDHFSAAPGDYFIDYEIIKNSLSTFLVNVNLRQSLPILNAKIKSLIKDKGLAVLVVGTFANFNFQVKHLTALGFSWLNILEGLHWSSNLLTSSAILGSSDSIAGQFRVLKLFNNPAARDVNLISNFLPELESAWAFSWNDDSGEFVGCEALNKIYVGSHGGVGAYSSNIILASSSSIETEGLYVNSFGFQQKSGKVLFNAGNSRDEKAILLALNLYFECGYSAAKNPFRPHSYALQLETVGTALLDDGLNGVKTDFVVSCGNFIELGLSVKKTFFSVRLSLFNNQFRESLKLLQFSKILSVAGLLKNNINNFRQINHEKI